MTDLTCDVAVIGAGTAGLAAQSAAYKAGARTLLIDRAFAGTTCATAGCMPSKLLIAAADAAHGAGRADLFGIRAEAVRVDGAAVMHRVRAERDRFVAGVKRSLDKLPEEVRIRATARFTSATSLALDDGRRVHARAVVIATGAEAAIPGPFADLGGRILTNASIFELTDLPQSVAVVGAGPVGLELGQALARLGVRVEIFDQADRIGGLQDGAVSDALKRCIENEVAIHLNADIKAESSGDAVRLGWGDQSREFERLLVAAGRPPDLSALDLQASDLALDDRGTPEFDPATLQCGDAPVFIAGDANHHRPLLHEASDEGTTAGRNAARFPDITPRDPKVPLAVTFSRPEAATVGTVPAAGDDDSLTAAASYDDQGRARVEGRLGGLCHIYADRRGRLTGASLCAPDAGHLAHLLAWSIGAGATASDLLNQPFYHPTLEEGLKPALQKLCEAADLDQPGEADPPGA